MSGGVGVAKNINAGGDITGDAGTFSSTLNANGGITVNDGSSDTFTVAAPTGNTVIGGTLSVSGSSQISDDTESPSTSAGALVVSGGVGVAKNINAGGDITGDAGTFSSTLNANGGITVNDGSSDTFTVAAPTGNTVIGGTLSVSGSSQISDDTESPSTSAGALVVSGGVGVAKNINAGGDITGVAGTFSGVVTISDDTQSPSSSAGALIVSGGVGVAKNINAGGDITGDAGTFSSTLNANGGITVNGGGSDTFTVAAPTGNTVIGGTLDVTGQITTNSAVDTSSDGRLKTDIVSLQTDGSVLDRLKKLRGVYYRWNDIAKKRSPALDDGAKIGFIAQEIEAVFPELVSSPGKDGYIGVYYAQVTSVLVEAIKELAEDVDRRLESLLAPGSPEVQESRSRTRVDRSMTETGKSLEDLLDRLNELEKRSSNSSGFVLGLLVALGVLFVTNVVLLASLARRARNGYEEIGIELEAKNNINAQDKGFISAE